MRDRGKTLLWLPWLVCQMLGLACAGIFAAGVLRDRNFGQADLLIDLSQPSDWRATSFRVWGAGAYRFHLTTVGNRAEHLGAPFQGRLEVRLADSRRRPIFHQEFASIEHRLPANMEWTNLGELQLDETPLHAWSLEARVVEGDPRFEGAFSHLLLRKVRGDVGMGGLLSYVMIVPAGIFEILAVILAVALVVKGHTRIPLAVSGLIALAMGVAVTIR